MGQDTVSLKLEALVASGTKQAFKAVSDGFKSLGTEVKKTAIALSKAGKTEAADMMGHLSMAMDRVTKSSGALNKTGKDTREALTKNTRAAKDYSSELDVVQKAHAKWSNVGKATGTALLVAQRRTDLLSKSIHELGASMKLGGASTDSINKWKESLNFDKVWKGMQTGQLKTTSTGFKDLTAEGRRLLGVQKELTTSLNAAGQAHTQYHAQVKAGTNISNRYAKAVAELGKSHGKANNEVKIWGSALNKVDSTMERVRASIGKATNMTNHWTRTTKYSNLTQAVLQGNLEATNKGFNILNEKGLKAFSGLSYKAADSMKMLSKNFDALSVKTGAKTLTDYGKAVDAARGQTDKFGKGLTTLATKHGVASAAFRSQYEDMKKSDAIWNKHVTTLQKTGKITEDMAVKMRTGFNAAATSSTKLAESLSRPAKQNAELEKTINRVSVATGKSTESIRAQSEALKAQGLPHTKVINSLNASIGAQKEYSKHADKLAGQERELAKLRGQSVNSIRKVSDAILNGAKSEKQLIQVAKIRSENLKDQIGKQKESISMDKRVALSKAQLVNKYKDLIGQSKLFDGALAATAKRQRQGAAAYTDAQRRLSAIAVKYREARDATTLFGRALQSVGTHVRSFASYATAASIIAGLVGGFQQATIAVIEYDQALKDLQAITSATDREVALMGETIKRVASTTKFSASEVAAGMKTLGQAGLSAKEAVQTIQAVSDLATGTLSDMGTSVDLVTTAMRVFDIQATDSGRIADVFANAVNRSKLTVDKLRVAFNYVGPIAARAGVSFEEVAGSMMVLANSGIRASTIGTGLRQVFSKLVKPTKAFQEAVKAAGFAMDDFNLKSNSMRTVIERLSVVVTDAEDAFKMFGLRGASAISALTATNVEGFDSMMEAVSQTGTAAAMAAKQMEGLGVKIKNMWDKAKNLAIALGEAGLSGALHLVVDGARALITVFTQLAGAPIVGLIFQVSAASVAVIALTTAMKMLAGTSLVTFFTTTAIGIRAFTLSLVGATAGMSAFWVSLGPIGQAMLIVTGAVVGAISIIKKWRRALTDTYNEHKNMAEVYETMGIKITSYREKVAGLDKTSRDFKDQNKLLRKELEKAGKEFTKIGAFARRAQLSIHALDGTFFDAGEAVNVYYEELKKLESIELKQAADAAEAIFENSLGFMDETTDKVMGLFDTMWDGAKSLAKMSGNILNFGDFDSAAKNVIDFAGATEGAIIANSDLNEVLDKFDKKTATYKELKEVLLDSNVAASRFGKSLTIALTNVEEVAVKTLTDLLNLNKINLTMTDKEILQIAKSLGMITDEAGNVARAIAYMATEMRLSAGEAIYGLASSWGKELSKTESLYADTLKFMKDGSNEEAVTFLKNNALIIKGYEDRRREVAKGFEEAKTEFAQDGDWEKRLKQEAKYNKLAKKIQKDAREDEALNRAIGLEGLAKWAKKKQAKIEETFNAEKQFSRTYWAESLKLADEYAKKYGEIMGTRLDPDKIKADFKSYAETQKTELASQLLVIEKANAEGYLSDRSYAEKKSQLTVDTYSRIMAAAKKHYEQLAAQEDVNPKEVERAYKRWQKASQRYYAAEIASIRRLRKEREKDTQYTTEELEDESKLRISAIQEKVAARELTTAKASAIIKNEQIELNDKLIERYTELSIQYANNRDYAVTLNELLIKRAQLRGEEIKQTTDEAEAIKRLAEAEDKLAISRKIDAVGVEGIPSHSAELNSLMEVHDLKMELADIELARAKEVHDEKLASGTEAEQAAALLKYHALLAKTERESVDRTREISAARVELLEGQWRRGEIAVEEYAAAVREAAINGAIDFEEAEERIKTSTLSMAEAFEYGWRKYGEEMETQADRTIELATTIREALYEGMVDPLMDMITGTKTGKEAFADFAKSIINDITRILLKMSIAKILGSGGSGGGIFGAIFSGMARGGLVGGTSPSKTSDNIPIMATAKEYVEPVDVVEYYGVEVFEAFRKKLIPKDFMENLKGGMKMQASLEKKVIRPAITNNYAQGGQVQSRTNNAYNVSVPVSVSGQSNNEQLAMMLQQGIEDTVLTILKQELR